MKLHRISATETELHRGNDVVFFSYDTPVAFFQSGAGYFQTDETFSRTTTRHIKQWLCGRKAQVVSQEKIAAFLD